MPGLATENLNQNSENKLNDKAAEEVDQLGDGDQMSKTEKAQHLGSPEEA